MVGLLQGLLLGVIMVMPGMSGGTAFLIMGIYEKLIRDLSAMRIRPHLPLGAGIVVGMLSGGMVFALVFEAHRDMTAAFLLGCILASIRAVLRGCPRPDRSRLLFLIGGLLAGIVMAGEPLAVVPGDTLTSPLLLIVGGAFATAAMVIPGIPGSSVLIVLGIYDSLLLYVKDLVILQLLYFGLGAAVGLMLLVQILERLYRHYRYVLSYFFAGLIMGAARSVLPGVLSFGVLLAFVAGFLLVWYWSGKRVPGESMDDSPCAPPLRHA